MKTRHSFTITIEGDGDTPEQAWEDATLNLALYGNEMPEDYLEVTNESED